MTPWSKIVLSAVASAVVSIPPTAARADVIDGNWCGPNNRTMTIDGPQIMTPGGSRIRGDYGRHGFSYVVPEPESGAGSTIVMVLLDEHTVHLRVRARGAQSAEGPVQIWKRCNLST